MRVCNLVRAIALVFISGTAFSSELLGDVHQAEEAPPARLYWPAKTSDAHLALYKAASSDPPECLTKILVDDKPAADLKDNEVAHLGLTIGGYRLVSTPSAGCGMSQVQVTDISVKAGDAIIACIGEKGEITSKD